ncbi:hypothetical protein M3Y94_00774100 [Aphelenchoides besseyi]|nr:hypothetical protein M3Y94_00774100 [Aphelenchoides besseyi]
MRSESKDKADCSRIAVSNRSTEVHKLKILRCQNTEMFNIDFIQREGNIYVAGCHLEKSNVVGGELLVDDRILKINDIDITDRDINTAEHLFAVCPSECKLTVSRVIEDQGTLGKSYRELLINKLRQMDDGDAERMCEELLLHMNQLISETQT